MTATCTPPGSLPAQPPDASADPPTVPLPVQPGAVVVQQVPVPARRGGRTGALALAAAALVAAGVGAVLLCAPEYAEDARTLSVPTDAPASFPVTGSATLTGSVPGRPAVRVTGASCTGTGAYAALREGAPVTVADAGGSVVATGTLGQGRPQSPATCSFTFTVPGVPAGSPFYLVEVGDHGAYTYSAAHLQTRRVDLQLGD